MRQIVTADIGGTHARFALASIAAGEVVALDDPVTLKTGDHASLRTAWEEFAGHHGGQLPRELAMAFAGPVGGELLKLTNNPWVIRPALMGTKLGVAALLHRADDYDVIETEGGHIDFAPLDPLEDQILAFLRKNLRRVSVERIVAGSGIVNIHNALAAIEGRAVVPRDDKALWSAAFDGSDSLAAAALDRYCLCLGAVAGDLALAQGAAAVVIAGGLGLRLKDHLPRSGFANRFVAKGRFERRMEAIPVKLVTHPQPGLFGAAAAFARTYR